LLRGSGIRTLKHKPSAQVYASDLGRAVGKGQGPLPDYVAGEVSIEEGSMGEKMYYGTASTEADSSKVAAVTKVPNSILEARDQSGMSGSRSKEAADPGEKGGFKVANENRG
jgi:hypothetical protein